MENHLVKPSILSTPVERRGLKPANSAQNLSVDDLAVEEPLEIRIEFGPTSKRERKSISITMRTPGHDFELAVGFLFTEGLIQSKSQIQNVEFCGPSGNVVRVDLTEHTTFDMKKLERHFYTTSSCGVCGKASIEALRTVAPEKIHGTEDFSLAEELIHALPQKLRAQQGIFDTTGGLHACALFDLRGNIIASREDVGRHNALDKLIGFCLLQGKIPLNENILLVSGRASFELVQKASMAQIPIFAAVGAPSSLALELAQEQGMTLLGFVREERFNIYNRHEKVRFST